MARFVAAAVLLVVAQPAFGWTHARRSLPDLVGRSETILVGTATPATILFDGEEIRGYRFRVTDVLLGNATKEVLFPVVPNAPALPQTSSVVFVSPSAAGFVLDYPFGVSTDNVEMIRRLLRWKADPRKFMADPAVKRSTEFLELLGAAFEVHKKINSVDRKTVVAHVRDQLNGAADDAVTQGLRTLWRLNDTTSAATVIPLLKHTNQGVVTEAVYYLRSAKDRASVPALCEALKTADGDLDHVIVHALDGIGDPAAVPALERAVRRGVLAHKALANLGDEAIAPLLFEGTQERVKIGRMLSAVGGLTMLIRRSNKPVEEWMDDFDWVRGEGLTRRDDWAKWWAANKATFKVTKTAAEAFEKRK